MNKNGQLVIKDLKKLKKDKIALALISSMGNFSKAAKILNADYSSFVGYIQQNPELYNVYLTAKQQIVDDAESGIMDMLKNVELDTRTRFDIYKFILSTLGKDRGWNSNPQFIQQINTNSDVDIKEIFG